MVFLSSLLMGGGSPSPVISGFQLEKYSLCPCVAEPPGNSPSTVSLHTAPRGPRIAGKSSSHPIDFVQRSRNRNTTMVAGRALHCLRFTCGGQSEYLCHQCCRRLASAFDQRPFRELHAVLVF